MDNFFGSSGNQYVLNINNPLNSTGGEGIIYNINGKPDLVAKLYRPDKVSVSRENKLLHMVSHPPDKEVLDNIAWPQDVLYNSSTKTFAGFIMRKLQIGEDLNVMYEYGDGAKFPDMTWRDKIIIAMNLCWVLEHVHAANADIVFGDFNPKNISVDPNIGHITFLDTDSYHIGNGQYRCEVAMPEYIPQEIQVKMRGGGNLANASLPTFDIETDRFALAVHIFQLLMNGTHPFTCRVVQATGSVDAPQPIDNIKSGVFPFLDPLKGTTIPKFAPPLSMLTNELQNLFKRAFVDGHKNPQARPSPNEFRQALDEIKDKLIGCNKNPQHQYLNGLSSCPWCQVDTNMAQKKTPVISGGQISLGGGSPSATQTRVQPPKSKAKPKSRTGAIVAVIAIIALGAFWFMENEGVFDGDNDLDGGLQAQQPPIYMTGNHLSNNSLTPEGTWVYTWSEVVRNHFTHIAPDSYDFYTETIIEFSGNNFMIAHYYFWNTNEWGTEVQSTLSPWLLNHHLDHLDHRLGGWIGATTQFTGAHHEGQRVYRMTRSGSFSILADQIRFLFDCGDVIEASFALQHNTLIIHSGGYREFARLEGVRHNDEFIGNAPPTQATTSTPVTTPPQAPPTQTQPQETTSPPAEVAPPPTTIPEPTTPQPTAPDGDWGEPPVITTPSEPQGDWDDWEADYNDDAPQGDWD